MLELYDCYIAVCAFWRAAWVAQAILTLELTGTDARAINSLPGHVQCECATAAESAKVVARLLFILFLENTTRLLANAATKLIFLHKMSICFV